MGSLLFQILQAMAFPAISEVPALAFILTMCSFYAIRKQSFIAGAYRRFVFFLMYFMQFSMVIKLIVRIITKIQYIKTQSEVYSESKSVIAVKTLWGDFNPKNEDA
jgi:hypothetical protein